MATDTLDIQITADVNKASQSIDMLVNKLNTLSVSLGRINKSNFKGLTNGIRSLSSAMNDMGKVNVSNFSAVANGISKIANVNTSNLNSVASSLKILSTGFKSIENVNFNMTGLNDVSKALSSFGRKTSVKALNNLPQIKKEITDFVKDLNGIGSLNFDMTGVNNLVSAISRLGSKSVTRATSNLRPLKEHILGFVSGLNGIGALTFDIAGLSTFISSISRLGGKSVTNATANLRPLKEQVLRFVSGLNGIGALTFDVNGITNLVNSISKLGSKSITSAIANIPQLATSLTGLMSALSRAPRVSSNVIQMTQALANLASQGSRIGSASNSIVSGLNRTNTAMLRARKSTFSLASAFGMFYARYFLVIRGLKKLGSAITSTADYFESFNYFNVAMGKVTKEWDKDFEKYGYENAETYAQSFSERLSESFSKMSGVQINMETMTLEETGMKNLGFNIQQITQFASQLTSVTNSVGLTGEASLATADAFTKLAGDMSSLFNIDYSSVMKNLQSGLIGQSRALYKYGIDITNATLQTKAYELGLSKAVSEMTQGEKMQLRLLSILEQSKVAWGDQANTINTTSNMLRQLKNNISEAGMMFGQLFLPILGKVLPMLNGISIAIKRLLGDIAALFGIEFNASDFSQGYSDTTDSIDMMSDSLDDVTESAKKAKAGLRGFDELKTISVPSASSDSGGAGGGIDLTDEILKATEGYNKVWEEAYKKMENRAEKFADRVEKALKPIKKLFKDLSIGDYFAVGEDVSTIVSGINNFFARAIERVDWKKVGKNIGDFMAGINWTQVFSSFGRLFWAGVNGAIDMWKGSFKSAPIETTILSAIVGISLLGGAFRGLGLLLEILTTFLSPISKIVSTIGASFSVLGGIIGGLSAPVLIVVGVLSALIGSLALVFAKNEEVRQSFYDSVEAIAGNLQPALDVITNTVLPDLRAGWDRLLEILKPFGDFLNDVFVSIWQDFLNPALMYIGETVLPILIETFENLWNKILVPFGEFLGNVLEPIIKLVSNVFSSLWKNVLVPLGKFISEVFGAVFEGLASILNVIVIPVIGAIIDLFNFLWTKVLSPIVTWLVDSFSPVFDTVFSTIGGLIDGLKDIFTGIISFITGIFTMDLEKALNGIVGIFNGISNIIITVIESVVNFVIDGLNTFFGGFMGIVSSFGKVIGIDIEIPKLDKIEIPRYETGGFPKQYSLFMAGENGIPEMAGTVGGKTAVAGGAEITGIRDAIFSTSMQEMQLMREQNTLLRGILDKEFGISSDALFKSVKSSANDFTRRTGKRAFN